MALNCTFAGQVFIFGGKNTGPGARVGYAGTADVTFRALTANVALTANYASLATTASLVPWMGVQNAPAFVTAGQVTAVERATTANYTATANTALHVIDGAITSSSIANGAVGALQVSPVILTNNYFGNVSLNAVSLVSLTVAGTVYTAPATVVPHGKQRFTASGTFVVPAGVTLCYISMCGGGGGGGASFGWSSFVNEPSFGAGGGGGGQAYLCERVSVSPGSSITVTIGSGGTGADATTGVGITGGTTSFGSLLSATGGSGGFYTASSYALPGQGGAAGGAGGSEGMTGSMNKLGGSGGGSIFGAGGNGRRQMTSGAGSGYGGGGAGAYGGDGWSGGNGSPGFCLVEW